MVLIESVIVLLQTLKQKGKVESLKRRASDTREDSEEPDHEAQRKKRKVSGLTLLFPSDSCLSWGKTYIYKNCKRENVVKCVTQTPESSIKQAAHDKNDNSMIAEIGDIVMRVKEVHYHNSCRKTYTRSETNIRHPGARLTDNEKAEDLACEEAHDKASVIYIAI